MRTVFQVTVCDIRGLLRLGQTRSARVCGVWYHSTACSVSWTAYGRLCVSGEGVVPHPSWLRLRGLRRGVCA